MNSIFAFIPKPGVPRNYVMALDYVVQTNVIPSSQDSDEPIEIGGKNSVGDYKVSLDSQGRISVSKNVVWNGPTNFVHLTSFMRASCVHDVFYDLMRAGKLSSKRYKEAVDEDFRLRLVEDNCPKFLARCAYWAVRLFGNSESSPRLPKL